MARTTRKRQAERARYSRADTDGQVEASKVRLASSRRISRQTEVLIRESQETIERSRERLDQPARIDKS